MKIKKEEEKCTNLLKINKNLTAKMIIVIIHCIWFMYYVY